MNIFQLLTTAHVSSVQNTTVVGQWLSVVRTNWLPEIIPVTIAISSWQILPSGKRLHNYGKIHHAINR